MTIADRGRRAFCAIAGAAAMLGVAFAQDVTGIPNAAVNPGYASLSYRASFAADAARGSVFTHQVAGQKNFGERWSVFGGPIFGQAEGEGHEFRAFLAGLQYQFAEAKTAGADGSAVLILRPAGEGQGPDRLVLVTVGKWIVAEDYEIRSALGLFGEFGPGAKRGLGINTSIEATRRIGAIGRLGGHVQNRYGTTAGFGAFDQQSHQAGLVLKTIGGPLTINSTTLFGVSVAAPDVEAKLFFTLEL